MKIASKASVLCAAAMIVMVAVPVTSSAQSRGAPVITGSVAQPQPAQAAKPAGGKRCTRLAFEVNDYGKDGPTRDAKMLLDKHIADWAKGRGIKSYRVGQKTVNCRLFLDLIVFDEYTCRAEAPVCW
jgi:hypothetical protein